MIDPDNESGPAAEPPELIALDPYRAALRRNDVQLLGSIMRRTGWADRLPRSDKLAEALADRLGDGRLVADLLAGLGDDARRAAGLIGVVDAPSWPARGLHRALRLLGVDPVEALRPLLERGLLAGRDRVRPSFFDTEMALDEAAYGSIELVPHPEVRSSARTIPPDAEQLPRSTAARQVRETDGLEAVLRLGALWQRVDEAALRQTQQGALYKRDRERLEDDPVLAGPIADSLEPLPDMTALWLSLARDVGLLTPVPGTDRIVAADADYWAENAVHLPQMVAARWLGLWRWQEQGGMQEEGTTAVLAWPFARAAALLWLATLDDGEWAAPDDLDELLGRLEPGWDRATLDGEDLPETEPKPKPSRGRADRRVAGPEAGALVSIVLGPAYVLGLVRAADEALSGRRVVQLTALGRYVLALGPPPPPRPVFDQFLFVQPNFEVIAYRQGLNPALIGQFSRFLRWEQLGAALELKLTPESIYRGLEGGLTPDAILDRLARHTGRALPAGVPEAVRTWSGRRERVTYHAAATLIEFATPADLHAALEVWPADTGSAPLPVGDRLLLVEDERTIPFHRFRMTAARDYRRPPEACVDVEPDGITLSIDLGRSDLLVDAELARFADELPAEPARGVGIPRRQFRVSRSSLARALDDGMNAGSFERWFAARTGGLLPPAVRLLLHSLNPDDAPLRTTRPLVLNVATPELLDGLAQHPATRDSLGERLGPTSVIIPDDAVESLRRGLHALGLRLDDGPAPSNVRPSAPKPPR